jgi:hypothetical protein
MSLARARGALDEMLRSVIVRLTHDPVPAVRHQVQSRINMLFNADRDFMFSVIEDCLLHEENAGVLSGLLGACFRVLGSRAEWFAKLFVELESRKGSDGVFDKEDRLLTQGILRLWIQHGVPAANTKLQAWISDPIASAEQARAILSSLRSAILLGDPNSPDQEAETIRHRSRDIIHQLASRAVSLVLEYAQRARGGDEVATSRYVSAIRTLDVITTELFFGAGIRDRIDSEDQADGPPTRVAERTRFFSEFRQTLELLASVPHANVTHYLLQIFEDLVEIDPPGVFQLAMHALLDGGKADGYQFESLGADRFVKFVRRYIAEYRSALSNNTSLQRKLIDALDVFAEVGWPAARKLVYELPEMLR